MEAFEFGMAAPLAWQREGWRREAGVVLREDEHMQQRCSTRSWRASLVDQCEWAEQRLVASLEDSNGRWLRATEGGWS